MPFSKLSMILAVGATLVGCAQAFSGDVTWFHPGIGSCGIISSDTDFVAALSTVQAAGNAHCGQRISVQFQRITIIATVVDTCPGCAINDIALSPAAFQALVPLDDGGIHQVTWNFI